MAEKACSSCFVYWSLSHSRLGRSPVGLPCWSYNEAGDPPLLQMALIVLVCLWDCICVAINAVHGMDPLWALISPRFPSPSSRIVEVRTCDFCYAKRRSTTSGARQHLLVFHEAPIFFFLCSAAVITKDQGSLGLQPAVQFSMLNNIFV